MKNTTKPTMTTTTGVTPAAAYMGVRLGPSPALLCRPGRPSSVGAGGYTSPADRVGVAEVVEEVRLPYVEEVVLSVVVVAGRELLDVYVYVLS
jgi:hypothetical protein